MLTATRREWNELYVFFNLLAQGGIVLGNEEGLPSGRVLPIFQVTRQEHDGERRYTVEETDIHVEGEQMDERFPREDFPHSLTLAHIPAGIKAVSGSCFFRLE